jgi:hypothetical protein
MWDVMGYHGTAWASMDLSHNAAFLGGLLNRSLTARKLKKWLMKSRQARPWPMAAKTSPYLSTVGSGHNRKVDSRTYPHQSVSRTLVVTPQFLQKHRYVRAPTLPPVPRIVWQATL